ncbi:ATP-binding protein [Sinorhizobium meliloti]|uniref:ATP-binding protein n=1 Tax=Rhizobium meliloti TaxID=382 RepID=UPI0018658F35|nr:ATP-binding protein [Sinorhizobium meliloti]
MNIEVREITREEAELLVRFEETHFQDVKAIEIAPAKLSRTFSAFANTAAGDVYIGIDENVVGDVKQRSWRGFPDQEAANAIFQVLEGLAPASPFWSASFLTCADFPGQVLHLSIHKTRVVTTSTEGKAYIRRGAQNIPVTSEEGMRALNFDKGIVSFEDEIINAPKDLISNSATVIEFLIEQVPTAEPETWLRSQLILLDDRPTVAGALLFADQPQAMLPKRSAVKVFRYQTIEEGVNREVLAFDPLTIEGPIYDLIEKSVTATKEIVEGIKKIGGGGLEEISFPDETLHEIVTNAILHRDYSIATDAQIRIYDDRVEVESPGTLPGHITIRNILDEQFARNPKLVRLINKFPNPPNKDVGEGLNTAFNAMRRIRLKDPEIVQKENSVVVYIRHTRLSSPAQIVMEYLDTHGTITNQVGREITGIRRDVQMKDVFVALRREGALELVEGKRGKASAWRKVKK